jgi:hypothetical protein
MIRIIVGLIVVFAAIGDIENGTDSENVILPILLGVVGLTCM